MILYSAVWGPVSLSLETFKNSNTSYFGFGVMTAESPFFGKLRGQLVDICCLKGSSKTRGHLLESPSPEISPVFTHPPNDKTFGLKSPSFKTQTLSICLLKVKLPEQG